MATEGQFNPSKLDLILGVGVSELILYYIYVHAGPPNPRTGGPARKWVLECVCMCMLKHILI